MFSRSYDIISVGDCAIDTFLFLDDEDIQIQNIQGKALATISWGDKLPVQKFFKSVAGNAANNAIASARLGLKTAFYSVIGDDSGGREILHRMKQEGVDTKYLELSKKYGTNYHTALSNRGERTIFVYHGMRSYTLPEFSKSSWVYLTSIGKGFESIYPALLRFLKKHNVKLGFNPGTYQLRAGSKKNASVLERTDFLCINREEAVFWVGQGSYRELCERLVKLGPKAVTVTDGRRGAFSFSKEGFMYIPEYPGLKRIEATGAGDAFTSAYIAALARGKTHAEALTWGPVNAGSVVGKVGPIDGLLGIKEIQSWLKKKPTYKPIHIRSTKDSDRVLKIIKKARQ
ncbi:MAG TPA: carbohydrate kinase family protein [Patescibacteria group bacterium]|nr:carbohydrate kinase family protein [Patescibacteria group bacterium]